MTGQTRGAWGESLAADYLQKRGYTILARNWRCRWGELDLIAQKGDVLCFVEVKLRSSAAFAPPRAFVTKPKQQRLRLTAEAYLAEHDGDWQPRFDVAEVYAPAGPAAPAPTVYYWENAFE